MPIKIDSKAAFSLQQDRNRALYTIQRLPFATVQDVATLYAISVARAKRAFKSLEKTNQAFLSYDVNAYRVIR